MTYEDTIRRHIKIHNDEDAEEVFQDYGDVVGDVIGVGDTLTICEDANVFMVEDKTGIKIYWAHNLMEEFPATEYHSAKEKFISLCNKSLDGTLDKELAEHDELFEESQKVFKRILKESTINKGDVFKNGNGTIIEILEYNKDDDYVLYKINDKFYDTHIDSIETILSKNGYEKLNESKRKLKESREDTIFDTANKCSKILGVSKELPKFRIRNFGTDLVSYNGPKNTIFYHSDLLYISDETFVRTIIAHEMAHWAVGYEHNHDEVWVEAAGKLEDSLLDETYGIFENIDQYELKEIFKGLEPGKVMKKFLEVYPEIENHYQVGFNTEFGDLVSYNDGVLTIRPTFYCANDTKYVTEDQWNIAGVEAETLIDEED